MSDIPRTEAAINAPVLSQDLAVLTPRLAVLCAQLERELNDLRTDAARYRAVRGLCVGEEWWETPFFYSAACPADERYVTPDSFDQMADRLCEEPQ